MRIERASSLLAGALAAVAAATCAGTATADIVFRFHNKTGHAVKGIVQQHGIVYLSPGQVSEVRVEGEFAHHYQTPLDRPTLVPRDYIVNFEHLSNAAFQYCVWELRWEASPPQDWGVSLSFYPTLVQRDRPHNCDITGQLVLSTTTAHLYDIGGATLDIVLSQ